MHNRRVERNFGVQRLGCVTKIPRPAVLLALLGIVLLGMSLAPGVLSGSATRRGAPTVSALSGPTYTADMGFLYGRTSALVGVEPWITPDQGVSDEWSLVNFNMFMQTRSLSSYQYINYQFYMRAYVAGYNQYISGTFKVNELVNGQWTQVDSESFSPPSGDSAQYWTSHSIANNYGNNYFDAFVEIDSWYGTIPMFEFQAAYIVGPSWSYTPVSSPVTRSVTTPTYTANLGFAGNEYFTQGLYSYDSTNSYPITWAYTSSDVGSYVGGDDMSLCLGSAGQNCAGGYDYVSLKHMYNLNTKSGIQASLYYQYQNIAWSGHYIQVQIQAYELVGGSYQLKGTQSFNENTVGWHTLSSNSYYNGYGSNTWVFLVITSDVYGGSVTPLNYVGYMIAPS